ncbi:MAG: deoxyribose-phosphate aldolase [Gammaproteobacteria bacterium RIFCSPHIGHO2_12_FULL_63_22]|nr:MAG: deoxyribose-phosphate aldolase [Gammaproteobacteria bacterium RIFCSPHIGHO2_12_FULL_63_22]
MPATVQQRRELAARLLPLLDLTSLGEDDTPARIEALCASARTRHGLPAALCVYPEHITTVRRAMHGTAAKVATVVNFPDGGSDAARAARETRRALAAGADEIDLVLPYHALRRGERAVAEAVVIACREACGSASLKLIIETGELQTPDLIRQACEIGLAAGVDFLKTSTGKVSVNATPQAAALMLDAIARDGGRCGFKAAGGIRTLDDAALYLAIAAERLGDEWITPAHFRIGASTLFSELTAALDAAG